MNVKQLVDAIIEAIDGTITPAGKVFAGRIYPQDVSDEIWSVTAAPGSQQIGGNNAKYKVEYSVQINGFNQDAEVLYSKDQSVIEAIQQLVIDNPQIISAHIQPMSDQDLAGMEMRQGTWAATITTYAPGWKDWS